MSRDLRLPFVIHGARKIDSDGVVDDFWLAVDHGVITSTGTGAGWHRLVAEPRDAAGAAAQPEVVDAKNGIVTPGFIDLHSHGGGGYSYGDGPAALSKALSTHRAHGTTRSVLSLVTGPLEELVNELAAIADLTETDPLVLGSHLEGPFLSPGRRGAHDPAFLRPPDVAVVTQLIAAARGTLRQMTIAPELPNASESILALADAGVTVAIGHTEADYAAASRAFHLGARLLTHTFNAMAGITGRAPGPVVAALDHDEVILELVLDGVHVDSHTARLLFTAAPGRIALITDAMAAAGSADGDYQLGALDVTVQDGRATLAGTQTLAGSTLTQDEALRLAVTEVGVDPSLAVSALTATPARLLGLEHSLARLVPGFAADIVFLDHGWHVQQVWADGTRMT